ncbi:MAG: class I SAM-dependent methyltransferase [Gammaproteobacteria bacterium]|nr:class I SAM-dependent methyltransferase [Gammaproteobacteria bacterium]
MPETVFDNLAAEYDAAFSERAPARWLRDQVRARIAKLLPENSKILDIGCGTGDDALWFSTAGHSVVATDLSEAMLAATLARKTAAGQRGERIDVRRFDIAAPSSDANEKFDCAMSNFGALNCCADLSPLFECLSGQIERDGFVAFTIMGKSCLWEMLGFGLRGNISNATRRWRRQSTFESNGMSQSVSYHSPASVERMANGRFKVESIAGVGVFVPSTEFFKVCEYRPRLLRSLSRVESVVANFWPFNRLGDHYLMIMRKVS